MTCIHCKKNEQLADLQLCHGCKTLWRIGRIKYEAAELAKSTEVKIEVEKTTEKTVESSPEKTVTTEKKSIRKLFTLSADKTKTENFVEKFNASFQLEAAREENKVYQSVAEVSRAKDLIEIKNENDVLTSDEIAKIQIARDNSINRMFLMIAEQGPLTEPNGKVLETVYERKERYLTSHIQELKKKIAELKISQSQYVRRRTSLRADEIEKLSPEELEEFKKKARKACADDSPSKRQKTEKKQLSKDMRVVAKWLDQRGKDAIPACIELWGSVTGVTPAMCEKYLLTGDFD